MKTSSMTLLEQVQTSEKESMHWHEFARLKQAMAVSTLALELGRKVFKMNLRTV
jgi:hypothetical protein